MKFNIGNKVVIKYKGSKWEGVSGVISGYNIPYGRKEPITYQVVPDDKNFPMSYWAPESLFKAEPKTEPDWKDIWDQGAE